MKTRTRRGLIGAAIVAMLVILAVTGSRQATTGQGTVALPRFLSNMGVRVTKGAEPPRSGTFLLLQDLRDYRQEQPLLDWVSGGGHLVVADPGSVLYERYGVSQAGRPGLIGIREVAPGCAAPETAGVHTISVAVADPLLESSNARAVTCFSVPGKGAFAARIQIGRGSLVLLAAPSPLTDELLAKSDDAMFAYMLLGAHGDVVFGDPLPPGTKGKGVWATLPGAAKIVILEILIAAVLFALASGRRLGMPRPEEPVSPISASELVVATASLLRTARQPGYAGGLLRRFAGNRIARRSHLGPNADEVQIARAASLATGLPEQRVAGALSGPAPTNDQELISLARELEELVRRIDQPEGAKT